ncbi:MAG TPA: universal stress protein [Burkholderiaceae bacterium]|nr:universal stress protein [Burkholderiaceae bacterium]
MKLLIATDGSKNSLHAVQYAVNLLGKVSEPSSITLVSVHDDVAMHHARRFVGQQAIDEYLHELSEHDVAETRQLLDSVDIPHDTMIRTGHIASEIAAAAKEGNYDMIVLGSKGRSSLTDLLIGSVAKRVLELSPIPVVLVR